MACPRPAATAASPALARASAAGAVDDAVTDGAAYVIAVQDVLNVMVWDNPDVTGKFTVQPDGDVTLPFVGRVKASGLTVRAFEAQVTRALADGYIRDPRVAVTLDQYRGHRICLGEGAGRPGQSGKNLDGDNSRRPAGAGHRTQLSLRPALGGP